MRFSVFYFVVFLFCASSAYAETYYVAQKSNGHSDGTSFNDRMSVIDHNNKSFHPGDIIRLCSGDISSQIVIPSSGKADKPITYENYEKNPAILIGYFSKGAIYGEKKDFINITGLIIRDGKIGICFKDSSDNIILRSNVIYNMAHKGIFFNASDRKKENRNSNIVIGGMPEHGNELYNIGQDTGGVDISVGYSDNVIVSYNRGYGNGKNTGIDGFVPTDCNKVLAEYNEFYDHRHKSGEDGIDIKGSKNVILRYNVCYNNRANGININRWDGGGIDSENIEVYHNRLYDNRTNIRIGGSYNGVAQETHDNVYIWGNIIYDSTTGQGLSMTSKGSNYHVYNNIFYNNHGQGSKFSIYLSSGSKYFIKNNIFYSSSNNRLVYIENSASGINLDYNHYYHLGGNEKVYWKDRSYLIKELPGSIESNGTKGDPLFSSTKNYNFSLKTNSPCYESGTDSLPEKFRQFLDPDRTDWNNFPPKIVKISYNVGNLWNKGSYGNVSYRHSTSVVRGVLVSPSSSTN